MPALDLRIEYILKLGMVPIPVCGPDCKVPGCTSPGKAPHLRGWQEYARNGPVDTSLLFAHHTGNVGIAIRPGYICLDIDKRSGGLESLDRLLDDLGIEIPPTLVGKSGGQGLHYHLRLPGGTKLPAQGNLASLGYPGVEWKTAGGQVVSAPSTHVSGGSYQWIDTVESADDIAMIPTKLLGMIHKVALGQAPQVNGKPWNGTGPKYTADQRDAIFRAIYPEGGRREALLRIVGMAIARGVCEDHFTEWALKWAPDHFVPMWDAEEVRSECATFYRTLPARQGSSCRKCSQAARGEPELPQGAVSDTDVANNTYGISPLCIISDIEGEKGAPESHDGETCPACVAFRDGWTKGPELFPWDNSMQTDIVNHLMRKIAHPGHAVSHTKPTKDWKKDGNAVYMRRAFWTHLTQLWSKHLADGGQLWRGEDVALQGVDIGEEPAVKILRNRQNKVRRDKGLWHTFTNPRERRIAFYSTTQTPGSYEVTLNTLHADLYPVIAGMDPPHLTRIPMEYMAPKYKRAFSRSREWKPESVENGEWETIGFRGEDPERELPTGKTRDAIDAEMATRAGVRSWVADEKELGARAPGEIAHSRHFMTPDEESPRLLSVLKYQLGYFLTGTAMAELRAYEGGEAASA